MLEGTVLDLGDFLLQVRVFAKGRRRHLVLHVSAPEKGSAQTRRNTAPVLPRSGKVDGAMDLQADKQVTFSVEFTDEMGNPVSSPANMTAEYSVDASSVIALTDNGDGTCVAASTGQLGTAVVHVNVMADGFQGSGDELITVVAGDAERVILTASAPTEVTPD